MTNDKEGIFQSVADAPTEKESNIHHSLTKNKPSLRHNIFSLALLQGGNYLFPLLTLPWLTRVLGVEGFGRIGFATAFCMNFSLFSDYGFNLSATRQISIHRSDRVMRSRIFWSTLATKSILALAGFVLLVLLTIFVQRLSADKNLLLVGYIAVIGTVITPVWYFQGVEQMSILTKVNLAARTAALPIIFLTVRQPDDLLMAMIITSGSGLFAGCLSMAMLVRLKQVDWMRPTFTDIKESLYDGWHLFISSAASSLSTVSTTVILGFIAGNTEVGYFTAAQRLARAAQAMIAPINQAIYPRISHLMHHSRNEAFALIRKLLKMQVMITLAISIAIVITAKLVTSIVFGNGYEASVTTLRWLAPIPFFGGLTNVFGVQTMIPLGRQEAFSRIIMVGGLVNLAMMALLGSSFGASGAGAAICISDFITMACMSTYVIATIPEFCTSAPISRIKMFCFGGKLR